MPVVNAPQILIVDDSRTIRRALSEELQKIKAQVIQAENGRQGLALARNHPVDLVITDVDMPKMNGFELSKELKNNPFTQSVPIIILSSNESEEHIESGFAVGAAAYLSKTNATQVLIPTINRILKKNYLLRDSLILVADDSRFIRTTVTSSLSQAGFKVLEAADGLSALEILKEHKPNLILSDIQMPRLNGIELCEKIQKNIDWAEIPFVVMSTLSDRKVMREIVQKGASTYLVKPFNVEQLIITIEKLLSDHFQIMLQEKKRLSLERNMLFNSIASLVQALESRDAYTRGHSEVVANVSGAIGESLGFSDSDQEKLILAGKLHDIGKIGIRDNVLLKPGKLTDQEFELIKEHPAKGAEILKPIPSMAELLPAVKYHHEKMDGTGYPEGLKGKDIHLWARIIAVADVFHALSSKRPYHNPLSLSEVLEIIKDLKGHHLCPECVRHFFKLDLQERISRQNLV